MVIWISGFFSGDVFWIFMVVRDLFFVCYVSLCFFSDFCFGEFLDCVLVFWFLGFWSFIGEDCVEFYVYGGLVVVSGVL